VNDTDVAPAAIVTLAGTAATLTLLLESATVVAVGAAALKLTVPVEVVPPATLAGLRVRPLSAGAPGGGGGWLGVQPESVAVAEVEPSLTVTLQVEEVNGSCWMRNAPVASAVPVTDCWGELTVIVAFGTAPLPSTRSAVPLSSARVTEMPATAAEGALNAPSTTTRARMLRDLIGTCCSLLRAPSQAGFHGILDPKILPRGQLLANRRRGFAVATIPSGLGSPTRTGGFRQFSGTVTLLFTDVEARRACCTSSASRTPTFSPSTGTFSSTPSCGTAGCVEVDTQQQPPRTWRQ
jgi:hypothetical protein